MPATFVPGCQEEVLAHGMHGVKASSRLQLLQTVWHFMY